MAVYTYNPDKVNVGICGYKLKGVKSVSVTVDNAFKLIKGTGNKNTRVPVSANAVQVEIEVLQTSTTNNALSRILAQDITQNNVRLSFALFDNSGTTGITSDNAFILGYPETTYTEQLETRRWTISLLDYNEFVVGGNNVRTAGIFDMIKQKIGEAINGTN